MDKHSLQHSGITISLDNESALKEAEGTWPLVPQQSDYDLLHEIRATIQELPLDISFRWTRGRRYPPGKFGFLGSPQHSL